MPIPEDVLAEADACYEAFQVIANVMIDSGFDPSVVSAAAGKLWMGMAKAIYPDPDERRELAAKIIEHLEVDRN